MVGPVCAMFAFENGGQLIHSFVQAEWHERLGDSLQTAGSRQFRLADAKTRLPGQIRPAALLRRVNESGSCGVSVSKLAALLPTECQPALNSLRMA